jgi:hypothetical protein
MNPRYRAVLVARLMWAILAAFGLAWLKALSELFPQARK